MNGVHGIDDEYLGREFGSFGKILFLLEMFRQEIVDEAEAGIVFRQQDVQQLLLIPDLGSGYRPDTRSHTGFYEVPEVRSSIYVGEREGLCSMYHALGYQFFRLERAVSKTEVCFAVEVHDIIFGDVNNSPAARISLSSPNLTLI